MQAEFSTVLPNTAVQPGEILFNWFTYTYGDTNYSYACAQAVGDGTAQWSTYMGQGTLDHASNPQTPLGILNDADRIVPPVPDASGTTVVGRLLRMLQQDPNAQILNEETQPDGTIITSYSDGTVKTTYTDGFYEYQNPDGSTLFSNADGTEQSWYSASGEDWF